MLSLIIVRKIASKNRMELSVGTKLSKLARNVIAALMTVNVKKNAVIQGKGLKNYQMKNKRNGGLKKAANGDQMLNAHLARDHAVKAIVDSLPHLRKLCVKVWTIAPIRPTAMEIMLRVQNHPTNQTMSLNVTKEPKYVQIVNDRNHCFGLGPKPKL
jgi:hypothetical protein